MIYLGEGRYMSIVDVHFLVPTYESVYNYILGTPFFVAINIFASTIHLKNKYHNIYDKSIIVHIYLARSLKIHEILLKDPNTTILRQERKVKNTSLSYHNI